MKKIKNIKLYGFTLIELLIVLAILGVLAVVVLIAINPTQQLAKGRDTGRKSSVTQLGRELASYFTARAIFPRNNNCTNMTSNWMDCLVAAGSLREIVGPINYSANARCKTAGGGGSSLCPCTTGTGAGLQWGVQNDWCYVVQSALGDAAVVYAPLESDTLT
ncbi:hypothetical protein A3E41_05740, partial [Candidatus Woesebacteria bacterium RIFCSPHIGHO2_12_FULL_38_9]